MFAGCNLWRSVPFSRSSHSVSFSLAFSCQRYNMANMACASPSAPHEFLGGITPLPPPLSPLPPLERNGENGKRHLSRVFSPLKSNSGVRRHARARMCVPSRRSVVLFLAFALGRRVNTSVELQDRERERKRESLEVKPLLRSHRRTGGETSSDFRAVPVNAR